MSPLGLPQCIIKFGDFETDLRSGDLRKSGVRIKLQAQPFQLLQALLERPGEVVTREELQKRIWPADTFVDFDQGLNNAVKRLRLALGDHAESPQFIETIAKRGYRFTGTVFNEVPPGAPASLDAQVSPPSSTGINLQRLRRKAFSWRIASLAFVAGTLLALSFTRTIRNVTFGDSAAVQVHSLAVLPMQNLSGDPAQEYFSDGVTDALITDLAQIGSLRVISRTSSMQYKQTRRSLPQIARELKVDAIVEGSVQRSGDRVRITAHLVYVPSDKQLWANSYERDLRDVFALERDVTHDIARQVRARLTDEGRAGLAEPQPVSPGALDAYLLGNSHMHKFSRGSGDEELRLAGQYFRQAIEAQPDFALAYVGVSRAQLLTLRSSTEDAEIAKKSAERAIELSPKVSEAWTQLADIKCDFWEWIGAEQNYRRALELNPNDAVAHEHLGYLLEALGRMEEGWKEADLAQQLDPNQEHIEVAFDHRHQYEQSIQHLTTMLVADPDNGTLHHKLYESYAGRGMLKDAIHELERALVLFGLADSAAQLREAFAASGYRGAMRKYAEELERLYATKQIFLPINVAIAYTAAGDKERAFYWLEQGYKFRGRPTAGYPMVLLNREPLLEPLHDDARYPDLLRRIGLPR